MPCWPLNSCCRNLRPIQTTLLACALPNGFYSARLLRVVKSAATSKYRSPRPFPGPFSSASNRSLIFLRRRIPIAFSKRRKVRRTYASPELLRVRCCTWKMDGSVSEPRFTHPRLVNSGLLPSRQSRNRKAGSSACIKAPRSWLFGVPISPCTRRFLVACYGAWNRSEPVSATTYSLHLFPPKNALL